MEAQTWNNCFLCLNEVTLSTREKTKDFVEQRTQGKLSGFEVVFKYLLDTRNKTYEHVLAEILQEVISSQKEVYTTEKVVQFCSDCRQSIRHVIKLHLQLEVVQMKIISQLKKIKETIMTNSDIYGNNDATRLKLQLYEEWLARENDENDVTPPKNRKILEFLHAFQTAVFEKDKRSMDIPCVLLHKYCSTTPMSLTKNLYHTDVNFAGKTEPIDNEALDLLYPPLQDDLQISLPAYDDFPIDDHSMSDDELSWQQTGSCLSIQSTEKPKSKTRRMATTKRSLERNKEVIAPKKRGRPRKEGNKIDYEPVQKVIPKKRGRPRKEANKIKVESLSDETNHATYIKPFPRKYKYKTVKEEILARTARKAATAANCRIAEIQDADDKDDVQADKVTIKADNNDAQIEDNVLKRKMVRDVSPQETTPTSSTPKVKQVRVRKKRKDGKPRKLPTPRLKMLPFVSRTGVKNIQKYFCQSDNCNFTSISPFRFEHHLRDHEVDEKRFPCHHCPQSFSGKQHFDFHTAFHQGYNQILCDLCAKLFLAVELVDHMKTHDMKVFPCPNCSHCTSTREKYLDHLHQHHGMKGKWLCDICNVTCRSRQHLFVHLFHQHQAVQEVVCEFEGCGKRFLDPKNLAIHRKVHTQPFECGVCREVFGDDHKLKAHMMRHNGGSERPFQCEQCPRSFCNQENLQNHRIRAHGAEKYKCQICSKEYLWKTGLQYHMTTHDGTTIPCGFPGCDSSFPNKFRWLRHRASHSEERNHVCEECGMQFKTKGRLQMHAKIHVNDRKFKCPHCDKAFILKKYLVNHVRIHTGEKPFVCDLCGKDFNQYAALYQHKKKHLGSAAPPVNPEYGRPRAMQTFEEEEQKSTFFGLPGEPSGSHPVPDADASGSLDNDSKSSQLPLHSI